MAGAQKTSPKPDIISLILIFINCGQACQSFQYFINCGSIKFQLDLVFFSTLSIISIKFCFSEQPDAKRHRAKLLLKTFTSVLAFDIFKMNLILATRRRIVTRSASMIGTSLLSEKLGNILQCKLCSTEDPCLWGGIALKSIFILVSKY